MKRAFHPVAALLLMCVGIGSGCAENGAGGQRASDPKQHTHVDAGFLSGNGFVSGRESYAAHEAAGGSPMAKSALPENGAHFTHSEHLFLTGAAFYSGPGSYPISW